MTSIPTSIPPDLDPDDLDDYLDKLSFAALRAYALTAWDAAVQATGRANKEDEAPAPRRQAAGTTPGCPAATGRTGAPLGTEYPHHHVTPPASGRRR